ncbi:hypothetical protein HY251_10635 [bacterium]|nr:hypothetical protein [bacterium]
MRLCVFAFSTSIVVAGCVQEAPVRKTRPPDRPARAPEERRARPISTPGSIGSAGDSQFYMVLQRDRPEAARERPVLVEEDARRREVGAAYLSGPAVLGFVDRDVVVVATKDELTCYDVARHETRWSRTFDGRAVDDFVRRADRLEVSLEGGTTVTLNLATGERSLP